MNKKSKIIRYLKPRPLQLELNRDEAEELFAIMETILKDNTPKSNDLSGGGLVNQCLLFNDPECFRERNRNIIEESEPFSKSPELTRLTYQDAEGDYSYLSLIANIYKKLFYLHYVPTEGA